MTITSPSVPRLDGPGWPARDSGLHTQSSRPLSTDREPPVAKLGTMRTTLDRAGRELYELWRSALADGDDDLADRLTVVSHALHRASAALENEVVLPNRRDSATSCAVTPQAQLPSDPAPPSQPEPCLAEADVYSLDSAAEEADAPSSAT